MKEITVNDMIIASIIMKKNIHPKYFDKSKVECSCGAVFEVGSTVDKLKIEICSNCHPAYTGNKKLIDSAGRVDRFEERLKKSKKLQELTNNIKKIPKTAKVKDKKN